MRMSSVIRYIFLPPAPRSTFTLGTSVALPPAPPAPCPPDAARAPGADFAGWDHAGAAASSSAPVVTVVSRVAFVIYLACPCWGAAGAPPAGAADFAGPPAGAADFPAPPAPPAPAAAYWAARWRSRSSAFFWRSRL